MIRGATRYLVPRSRAEAVAALADEHAVAIGGGTMVLPDLAREPARERLLVDLGRAGLDRLAVDGDGTLVLGAMTSYLDLLADPAACAALPGLALASAGITGGIAVRGQGTIGGSAAYANPGSDAPACLVAADARLRLESTRGSREVAAADFFAGAFAPALEPGELLCEIAVPAPRPDSAWGYCKLKHAEGSWPIATAVCELPRAGGAVRFTLGGVAASPLRVELERERCEQPDAVAAAVAAVLTEPWSDALADGDYRRRIAPVAARRAFRRAVEQLEGSR